MPEPRGSTVGIGTLPSGKSLLDLPSHAPQHLLVESSPSARQLAKHAFLAELKQRVIAGAAEELAGTQWSADQCPYLEYWFAYYETRSAEAIEAALHKYVPELARATEASAFFEPAVARVRRAIARWAGTGELDVPPAAMPAAIAASVQLGLGNPIESATRSRFESAMDADLSQVRVHADASGAQAAAGADARAFAIGNHVAFAANEYAPGTMRGDALLAHELAHTQQQTGAPSAGASMVHERAADRAATSIWSRLWGSIAGAPMAAAPTSTPRVGVQLQRCQSKQHETPEAFDRDAPPEHVVVVTNPQLDMDEPGRGQAHAVVGQEIEFSLKGKNAGVRNDDTGTLHAKEWAIYPPGATKGSGRWNQVAAKKVKFDQAGRWQIDYEGIHGEVAPFVSGITVDVISLDEAEQRFVARDPKKKPRLGYVPFRSGLAKTAIDLAHSGVKEQHLSNRTWIDSDNKNPAEPSFDAIHYRVKPSPGATTFEWYVKMDDWSGMPRDTYYGHQRTIRDGESAFAINSTGPAAGFTFADAGVFYVWCDELDAQHRLVDRVRYIQSVESTKEYEEGLGKWKSYVADVDDATAKFARGKLQQLETVFVDRYTGRARDLTIFVGPKRDSSKYLLFDLTFGAKRIEFEGDNLADAIHTFDKKNKYPDGLVKIHASASQTFSVTTNGESDLSKASHTAGHISMIPLAAGLIAAVVPGLEPAAPYLLGLAGVGGAVSGTLSLVDRLQQTHVDVSGAALDVVGIAASLIGSAQAVEAIAARRAAAAAGTAATAAHGSRFLLWAQFTTDAVGAVLISGEAIDQIDEINKRTGMADAQRIDAIVRILTGLALQGGMFVVSAKALAEAQPRLRSALGDAAMGRLAGKTEARALALLDEPAVNALRDVPASDLDRVAELVALDPLTAESALATGKVKSAAELEKAIAEGKVGDTPLADVRAPDIEPAKPPEPTNPVESTTDAQAAAKKKAAEEAADEAKRAADAQAAARKKAADEAAETKRAADAEKKRATAEAKERTSEETKKRADEKKAADQKRVADEAKKPPKRAEPKRETDERTAEDAQKDPNQQRRYDRFQRKTKNQLSFEDWWKKFGRKPPPNPYGKSGRGDHVETIDDDLVEMARKEFPSDTIIKGKSIRGKQTPKGKTIQIDREPDVTVVEGKGKTAIAKDGSKVDRVKKVYEAARTNADGSLVPREVAKQKQYNGLGVPSHFEPVKE